ncbi:P-loop NTPase fold protein [Flavobacterium adhaerens]|uniref:P-loop NTPase fold protein n=1 Tax=Flavobacterium adhaerens TaxID=3149043 RepID=UPI0032B41C0A
MEVADKAIKIETTQLLNDFKQHLDFESNKRILFSGPFGTGKSTFLKEFSEKECDDYFYLKIFPVNYSVSANEDVFELIKFDLLMQLMGNYYKEINLKKEDFTLLLKSQMFIMERMKFMPLLYAILGFSEKIGTPIVDFIKALEKTVGDFKTFSNGIKIDEENDITSFLASIENRKGSHHEMDAVSNLILDLVRRIKEVKGSAQSVLIIDDLDRLDPEHIFRLFNIFSAHYDEINGENKFGFDKVIFVCDIENIRKIFHHKYGSEVDFSGYIDKFYSIEPFDFDNRKYVKAKIGELLHDIRLDSNLSYYCFRENTRFYNSTKAIILSLVEARLLNLRMLLQYPVLKVPEIYFGKKHNSAQSSVNAPIIVLFYLLKKFYGSFDVLQLKIKNLYDSFDKDTYRFNHQYQYLVSNEGDAENLISFCLPFILHEELANERNSETNKTFFSERYNCTFHYNGYRYDYVSFKNFQRATKGNDANSEEIELNPYEILLDVFEICKKRGLLK